MYWVYIVRAWVLGELRYYYGSVRGSVDDRIGRIRAGFHAAFLRAKGKIRPDRVDEVSREPFDTWGEALLEELCDFASSTSDHARGACFSAMKLSGQMKDELKAIKALAWAGCECLRPRWWLCCY